MTEPMAKQQAREYADLANVNIVVWQDHLSDESPHNFDYAPETLFDKLHPGAKNVTVVEVAKPTGNLQ